MKTTVLNNMKLNKSSLYRVLGILVFILALGLSNELQAQPNNPTNPVPLDGGLSLLVAGGATLGYKKYKAMKNKETE